MGSFSSYVSSVQLLSLIMGLLVQMSCGVTRDINKAEIVALDPASPMECSLQVRELLTTPPLPKLANDQMVFVSGVRLRQHLISEHAQVMHNFDELFLSLQASMGAKPFILDFSNDAGIARGRSYESVLALSAYSHFERIFAFAQSIGEMLYQKRPLTIAVYGQIVSAGGHPQPISKGDNALYVGSADTVFLLPVGKEEGLPLTMHEGVLAHEFHHRIFFKKVWDNPRHGNLWQLFQSRYDTEQIRMGKRSKILLNALDEGLADIFAVAFTGLPSYLNISLTQKTSEGLRMQRDLLGDFAETVTFDALAQSELPPKFLELCGAEADNFENPQFNVYCLGTIIAKMVFESAQRNLTTLRTHLLPLVERAILAIAVAHDRGTQFDLHIFFSELARLASLESPQITQQICAQIRQRFASYASSEKIPSCKNFFAP